MTMTFAVMFSIRHRFASSPLGERGRKRDEDRQNEHLCKQTISNNCTALVVGHVGDGGGVTVIPPHPTQPDCGAGFVSPSQTTLPLQVFPRQLLLPLHRQLPRHVDAHVHQTLVRRSPAAPRAVEQGPPQKKVKKKVTPLVFIMTSTMARVSSARAQSGVRIISHCPRR